MRTGRCFCGAVRFEARGEPKWVAFCHCESCRRATSSPVAAFTCFAVGDVQFTGESLREHDSSPGVLRSFCGKCGSPLSYRTGKRPDEIDLYVASFDDAADWQPTRHDYYSEHLPWLVPGDGLPTRN